MRRDEVEADAALAGEEIRAGIAMGEERLEHRRQRARGSGTAEQESYDSYYIRNWSAWLDLYILSRTIAAVVSGRGAY